VLVYGPRKAGTTLFQTLLDGGDQIFAYPAELKVKSFVTKPRLNGDIEKYYARSRIRSVDSPHLSHERYRRLWADALEERTMSSQAEFVRYDAAAVFQSCDNVPDKVEMWCAKEVGGPTREILAYWREMFPGSKSLFITRDPSMVTRAVLNDRRRKGIRLSLRQIARETYEPMAVVAVQADLLADKDVFVIAYEDLVADTAGVMARVAAFLGIDDTPKFHEPTIFSAPVVVRTASKITTKVFQTATSWKDGLTLRELLVIGIVRSVAGLLPRFRVNYPALRRRLRERDSKS
jgi:hypothetical protein